MLKDLKKKLKGNSGFTILELIVVIAIMGFLVALVAPRLVDVASSSKKPVAVTNMQRLSQAVQRNIEETGDLPNSLGTIVEKDINMNDSNVSSADVYAWQALSARPKERLYFKEFIAGNNILTHILTKSEAEEIKKLGITKLIDYDDGQEKDIDEFYAAEAGVKPEGIRVLMIGAGGFMYDTPAQKQYQFSDPSNNTRNSRSDGMWVPRYGQISGGNGTGAYVRSSGSRYTRPDLFLRIVLGIGEDSVLAKKGLLKNVGKHPDSEKNKDRPINEYCLVLPRLQATLDNIYERDNKGVRLIEEITVDGFSQHLTEIDPKESRYILHQLEGTEAEARALYEKEVKPLKIVEGRKIKIEAQGVNDFAIIGPGNETYPASDVVEWEVTDLKLRDKTRNYGTYTKLGIVEGWK